MKTADVIRRKAKMRDKRFIAEHRGGPLKKEQHSKKILFTGIMSVRKIIGGSLPKVTPIIHYYRTYCISSVKK
jgi:hypothetical protein